MASPERKERTWRLTVAYLGTAFHGWQAQGTERCVQTVLEDAVARVAGERLFVRGAGRTDAGVHARGQTASVRFASRVEPEKLPLALSSLLPDDVAVTAADEMFEGFDAKRGSIGKRYVYRVLTRRVRDPFRAATHWHHRGPLDVGTMQAAAAHLVGELDYESFRASGCQAAHARRFLWKVEVTASGDEVAIEVRGNAFCQNQVRIMAGTLVEVGRGRFTPDDVAAMVAARDRTTAGMTAPACGLTLEEVYHPDTAAGAGIPAEARWPGYPPGPDEWPPLGRG